MEYNILFSKLQKELSDRRANNYKKGYKFNKNQQSIYDFVIGRKSIVQLEVNEEQYFIKKNDFRHILERHYVPNDEVNLKDGRVSSNDILNIANVIKNGRKLEEYEIKDNDFNNKIGYIQIKNDIKYTVILSKDKNGYWFISFFSNEEKELGDCF